MYLYVAIAVFAICFALVLHSPSVKGRVSEQAVALRLDVDSLFKHSGKTLTNVYVPKEDGTTSEIDILYFTHKGIFVIENKNYAGYIFGSESSKNWTVTLYAGKSWYGGKRVEKHQFYNPIWQNRTHIKYLKTFLETEIPLFSIVAFSDRGELKDITVTSPDVHVCSHLFLSSEIKSIWNNNPDVLSDEQIDEIYKKLLPLAFADDAAKETHVQNILERFNNTDVCPVCGGKLVLRTAKKGANAGKQFYGCSNYPKCKYIKNL